MMRVLVHWVKLVNLVDYLSYQYVQPRCIFHDLFILFYTAKLATTRESDPKVTHNKAVASFYKSGFTKTDEFKHTMVTVCSKVSTADYSIE